MMDLIFKLLFFLFFAFPIEFLANAKNLKWNTPETVLGGVSVPSSLILSPLVNGTSLWAPELEYQILEGSTVLCSGKLAPYEKTSERKSSIELKLEPFTLHSLSAHSLQLVIHSNVKESSSAKASSHSETQTAEIYVIPGILSILPSTLTVVVAMWSKQNILALLSGIWLGTTFYFRYNPIKGILNTIDTLIVNAMADKDHAFIMYFCMMIGGMIGVVGKGGGAYGLATVASKFAKTRTGGQMATWLIGVLTFFDDYASCLITGSTMRDITGQLHISREKLSFIVDTCAATISSLAPISSWIGVELSYIQENFEIQNIKMDPYLTFLQTIPFRFYPILVLLFCLMIIATGRDFGPMLRAEKRAHRTGQLLAEGSQPLADVGGDDMAPKEDKPKRWFNAVIPFFVAIVFIFVGIVVTGSNKIAEEMSYLHEELDLAKANNNHHLVEQYEEELSRLSYSVTNLFGHSNPYVALIWSSFISSVVAIFLVVSQRILTLSEAMDAWVSGCKSMIFALLILIHAWSLGSICRKLFTAEFIVSQLEGSLNPGLIPALVFIFSAVVSFTTGSAWGTMAILFPLVIPLAYQLSHQDHTTLLGSISSILAGSVWGNHTSPISDSCIMSSMSTGCDHADHVRTQAIYAVVVGIVSVVFCLLPVGMKWYSPWVGLMISIAILFTILYLFGKKVEEAPEDEEKEVVFVRFLKQSGVSRAIPKKWMSSMDTYPYTTRDGVVSPSLRMSSSLASASESTLPNADIEIPVQDDPLTAEEIHRQLHPHEDPNYYREHFQSITQPFARSTKTTSQHS